MKKVFKVTALVLVLCLLLTGCSLEGLADVLQKAAGALRGYTDGYAATAFEDMEYVRPDMTEFQTLTDNAITAAAESTDIDALMDTVFAFFDAYQWFYTYLNLADIHYCIDMTDIYWQNEYNYCLEQSAAVDAAREEVLYALADSPLRAELESEENFGAGYFDAYEGESIYDETFLALMEQEATLQNEYYEISSASAAVEYGSEEYYSVYGAQLAQVLVELVKVRREQAAYLGYDSYPAFAYDFYHGRDFTPDQALAYTAAVAENLSEIYRQLNAEYDWGILYDYCYEDETFAYVQKAADAMGGDISAAFYALETDGLYHISYGANKYNASFEVYLTGYDQPFVFMNAYLDASDKLTFAHEFGHFAADYVCWSSAAGTDVLEVHSQAMEYLSLIYGEAEQSLVEYKLSDCLCTYVEQSAYAMFEQQMYMLEGEDLTVQNIQALYEQVGSDFGFDSWAWDTRDYVTVPHFYTNPMYIISYVVSNDLAFQLYQQELKDPGAGLDTYAQALYSDQWYIMSFATEYGLEDPLDPARLEAVREILKTVVA